jgi:hydrogenase/urease accessory protein HupE
VRSLLLAATAALLLVPGHAAAHSTSTGLARIAVEGDAVSYRLTLVLGELPEEPRRLLAAAAAGDPAAAERVAEELRRRVVVVAGGAACRPGRALIRSSGLGDGRVDLELALRCPAPVRRLLLRDDWAGLLGEHHRTLARVDAAERSREIAFSPEMPQAEVDLGAAAPSGMQGFFRLGLEHILSGWDHLLFLAALLLRGGSLLTMLKIITAFTLAHSLTLVLATLGLVVVPGRIVEPAIAASIVWVALENFRAREAPSHRWVVSFVFGLIHGFGFATALQELSLPPGRLAWALLGFNLGVEAGQAAVLLAVSPLLVWLGRASWERRAVRLASGLIAVAGAVWFVQRIWFAA